MLFRHGRRARVEVGEPELEFAEAHRAAIEERLRAVAFEGFELAVYRRPKAAPQESS